jgi:hypothetical protein
MMNDELKADAFNFAFITAAFIIWFDSSRSAPIVLIGSERSGSRRSLILKQSKHLAEDK